MTSSSSGTAALVAGTPSVRAHVAWRSYAPIVVAAALLALVPLFVGDSRTYMGLAIAVLLFCTYATSFNVIFGATGQLFLCMGALAGVGGYGTAIMADRVGMPVVLAVLLSTVVAAALGALFSWVSVRRSLDVIFTGIVTLTFSLGFANLLLGLRGLTGGETGLVIDAGQGTLLRQDVPAYFVFLAVLSAFLAVFRWLQRSHFGWAFRALRDDEMTAELAGVDVARYRIWAGGIGSAMVGLLGALNTLHEGFISPSTFAFGHVDVRTLVMLAFGGIGTLLGPVIGAVSFGVIDEILRGIGQLRNAVYGVILVVLFLGFRGGVVGAFTSVSERLRRRRRSTSD